VPEDEMEENIIAFYEKHGDRIKSSELSSLKKSETPISKNWESPTYPGSGQSIFKTKKPLPGLKQLKSGPWRPWNEDA
jgi:hypothetical protein